MSEVEKAKQGAPQEPETQLEGGTYEIIRGRLLNHAKTLRERLVFLNDLRKQAFGSIETKLLSTQRVMTANNCIPRDMVAVGDYFLFGFNVHMGLRSESTLADVFAVYSFQDNAFQETPPTLIGNETFLRDFQNLYKYYKDTTFAKFAIIGPHIFMKFQTGKTIQDFKTFKWILQDGKLIYVDNRSDQEFRYPPQHEFEWIRVRRDWFRMGAFPHVSIEDRVFVETVGGDLTIKIEDNTSSGSGIYVEPVDNPDQTLDDAEIHYASIGHVILLKILPYQEKAWRYLIYNEKLQQVVRADAIADACVLLPDSHGLIFASGYYLLTGEFKQFETQLAGMLFDRRISSPNGEDYLYVFYNRVSGVYILLSYNLIVQKVETPIICNGFSLFQNGTLIYFRAESEATKHHAVQVWQTPYTGLELPAQASTDSPVKHIGNKDIVRAMAECYEVLGLVNKEDSYVNLYVDIAKKCTDIKDSYFWLREPAIGHLDKALAEIGGSAKAAIDEFEKVSQIKKATREEVERLAQTAADVFLKIGRCPFRRVDEFVSFLAQLRTLRGEIISCKERRYVDLARIATLEEDATQQAQKLSSGCVGFLLKDEALAPYQERVARQEASVTSLPNVAAARDLEKELDGTSRDLELMIEIVSNLKIDDPTQTTRIIDAISTIFSDLNRVKAALKNRRQEMARNEGVAEFNAQMKLLGQSVTNYLDVCDTPDKCEAYLTKLSVQVEELEGRFSEFDEFITQLVEKREELYNAFEAKRLALVEGRNRKASTLFGAAERIITGIRNRVAKFEEINEINGYFAGDLMVEKLRGIIEQLTKLEDSVKADDLQARLKTVREDAVRQLKDRKDLYSGGGNLITLGKHSFSVNQQNLALTVVQRDGGQFYHLTGTDFFEEILDPEFLATRPIWHLEIGSETKTVYRAEYLAWLMFKTVEQGDALGLAKTEPSELLEKVRTFMGPRYTEGYAKGVHDLDACEILKGLLQFRRELGLLGYPTRARALASLFWLRFCPAERKQSFSSTCKSLASLLELFPESRASSVHVQELEGLIGAFVGQTALFPQDMVPAAAHYLFKQLTLSAEFVISLEAGDMVRRFTSYLNHRSYWDKFRAALAELEADPVRAFTLTREWVRAFCEAEKLAESEFYDEVAVIALCQTYAPKLVGAIRGKLQLTGLKGSHEVIKEGSYVLDFNLFVERLSEFEREVVPRFLAYQELKKKLAEEFGRDLRLKEFEPRVLTSFVRNQLLDKVYLPLIGDNLAKQIGAAGAQTRTDRMGMLLLISPPGYGKTTLMEYIANRLGLIFMKINGPAIGHEVTSLDPVSAPHSAAREELNKLNLSLEMGDNVMIYLDDIQHCNPEFLQKFISLCDAQRKIEGIYKGRTRTYDLRGKKVAVVMAGNPYTESGEKFQIPDMLANRADTYNLGDIIGDNADTFELSYIENCLTSNTILNKLATRSTKDVYALVKLAQTDDREGMELEGNYGPEEIREILDVFKKLFRVRDVILRVNLQYIKSAAMEDAYRTEPAFKLQGSYRNMAKIAEKIVAIMNEQELESLISSHYENEAQTLTRGAEANLLKFKELTGRMNDTEKSRWEDIKRTFASRQRLHGIDTSDKAGQVVAQLGAFGEGLDAIKGVLHKTLDHHREREQRQAEKPSEPSITKTEASFNPESMAHLTQALEPLLDRLGSALGSLKVDLPPALAIAPPTAPALQAQPDRALLDQIAASREKEIRVMFKILKEQFEVIKDWVRPAHEGVVQQAKRMDEMSASVNNLMVTHGSLLNYLQQFQGKRSEPGRASQPTQQPPPIN